MFLKSLLRLAALSAAAGTACNADAQWQASYSIQRIGLFGPAQTGSAGYQNSTMSSFINYGFVLGASQRITGVSTGNGTNIWVYNPDTKATVQTGLSGTAFTGTKGYQSSSIVNGFQTAAGQVAGYSQRFLGLSSDNGRSTWVYNPTLNATVQIGPSDAAHTGTDGYQFSFIDRQAEAGQIAGHAYRITGVNTYNGQNTWVYNPIGNSTEQAGLTGPEHTGSAGFQYSSIFSLNSGGQVAGYSQRIIGAKADNGQNTWVYNPTTHTTVQTGLTDAVHTGSGGYQNSDNNLQNDAGQMAGYSQRILDTKTYNGADTWVYNPATNTTLQTGLTDASHTGSAGFHYSFNDLLSVAGQVIGYSLRTPEVNTDNGRNTWVYNPTNNATVQTGLTDAAHTGSAGYQFSTNKSQNAAGQVAGYSQRILDARTDNGQNAWIYNPTTNTTVQIGLTDAAHTGSSGYQSSTISDGSQTQAGQVAGYSQRITDARTDNGQNTWVYNPTTNTTLQTGLVDAAHTGGAGYQLSVNDIQNAVGELSGYSKRFVGFREDNGQNTWVYNPSTNTTVQTGLTDSAHTGSAGYQFSANTFQNAAGQIFGYSRRIAGMNTLNGLNLWVYNPVMNTTILIGLTGDPYTGSAGYQSSSSLFQNAAGYVAGYSRRIAGVSTVNGQDTWVYDPTTNATVQTGLTDASHTGSAGYQFSLAEYQNAAGQLAGYSRRISGVNTVNGQDAWYFDPTTLATSAIIGSVRTSDNYAFSQSTILTEGGFLLGNYTYFAGGLGAGEQRAFVFRPDLGLTDLGNLVDGGLTANGWSTLLEPRFSDELRMIVGYGWVNGQTGGQSVFVMVPAPGMAGLIGVGGVLAWRRRR